MKLYQHLLTSFQTYCRTWKKRYFFCPYSESQWIPM